MASPFLVTSMINYRPVIASQFNDLTQDIKKDSFVKNCNFEKKRGGFITRPAFLGD
jgi:hypothetical protein